MRRRLILLLLAVMSMAYSGTVVYGQADKGFESAQANSILVREVDVPGVVVRSSVKRKWVIDAGPSMQNREADGAIQEVELFGVKARIHYAEFESNDAAHQAMVLHIESVASVFRSGLWEGAKRKQIGDETWYVRDPGTTSLLVRVGKICALIGCREGSQNEQGRVAEVLAEQFASKAQNGARVPHLGDR